MDALAHPGFAQLKRFGIPRRPERSFVPRHGFLRRVEQPDGQVEQALGPRRRAISQSFAQRANRRAPRSTVAAVLDKVASHVERMLFRALSGHGRILPPAAHPHPGVGGTPAPHHRTLLIRKRERDGL